MNNLSISTLFRSYFVNTNPVHYTFIAPYSRDHDLDTSIIYSIIHDMFYTLTFNSFFSWLKKSPFTEGFDFLGPIWFFAWETFPS